MIDKLYWPLGACLIPRVDDVLHAVPTAHAASAGITHTFLLMFFCDTTSPPSGCRVTCASPHPLRMITPTVELAAVLARTTA